MRATIDIATSFKYVTFLTEAKIIWLNERRTMTDPSLNDRLRNLPGVDDVLNSTHFDFLRQILPHTVLVSVIRDVLDDARTELREDKANRLQCSTESLALKAATAAAGMLKPSLRRVINATGVIIHTNLGRSVLAKSAVDAVEQVSLGYSTLEYDIDNMSRGNRHSHCEHLICALTGAEAAIAVNNNAAAVLMVLSEFAAGKEAIVSRGELIEIGGSFRIPDIMELSRAIMVEVGTTNKTHISDYEHAVTENTTMLLKVHTSNYRLVGFTDSVSGHDLRRIADAANKKRGGKNNDLPRILVYEDLGSGALLNLPPDDEHDEPTVKEALGSGCDLVSFSGDKLLGGPQAGIIVGSKELIDRLKNNPLARALRLDKMTIAALEATLRLYLDPETARKEIPTLTMLNKSTDNVHKSADALAKRITQAVPKDCIKVEVVPEISRAGGGSLPMHDIDTYVVQVSFLKGNAQACEEYLVQKNTTPIIARIKQENILFDTRTLINDEELNEIADGLAAYFAALINDGTRKEKTKKETKPHTATNKRKTTGTQAKSGKADNKQKRVANSSQTTNRTTKSAPKKSSKKA